MNGFNPKVLNVLAKQQNQLAKNAPDGVIFYQNEEGDLTDIQADIIGPQDTPFHGGVFRCKLVIDGDFPQKPPKGYFLTKIFHPNVASNGDICVNTLKRDWDPAKWSLAHIFQIIKCLLIVPFPESALNEEAGRLFMESYDDFYSQAKLYTQIHAKPNAQQQERMNEQTQSKQKLDNKQSKCLENEEQTISLSGFNKSQAEPTTTGVLGLSQVQNSNMGFGGVQNVGFGSFNKNFENLENQSQDMSNAQNQNTFGNQGQGIFGSQNQNTDMFGNQIFSQGGFGQPMNMGEIGMGAMGFGSQPAAQVIKPNKAAKTKKTKCRI